MAKLFTLSAQERIKSRKNIETLFRSGKAFFVYPYKVIYLFESDGNPTPLQFMVSVPKKQFKHAVDRNRIKRQIREAWRTQNIDLKHQIEEKKTTLQVAFLYQTKEMLPYSDLQKAILKAIGRLEQLSLPNPKESGYTPEH